MVRWNAATDNAAGVNAYTLERKRYDDDWTGSLYGTYQSFSLGNVLFYNDTPLSQGYKSNYRIKATDRAGLQSAAYTTVDGYTVDTTPPDAVTAVTVTPTTGANKGYELYLTWNASSDTGVGLDRYRIFRRAETNSTDNVNSATGAELSNPASAAALARTAQERTFRTHDGVELFYRHWPALSGPARGAIAMFHRGHEHSGCGGYGRDERRNRGDQRHLRWRQSDGHKW